MNRLIQIIDQLRAPGGCPWDREQDHKSIMKCLIEEVYELADAVEGDDAEHLREELGDVLLLVVFHCAIAKDSGKCTMDDVITALRDKLIYRHPHVFGDVSLRDSREVLKNWERLKGLEESKKDRQSILDGVPAALPALPSALKIQSVASRVGFDWDGPEGAIEKIAEEMQEVSDAMATGDPRRLEDEVGDLLFSAVNLARLLKVDPEAALRHTNRKFTTRFKEIEKYARTRGIALADMPMDEKERIWQASKNLP
jgi:tetrapyrrole methylase family protein/MazG family protein